MKHEDMEFEDCNFCGATGEVWDRDFVYIILCPCCNGTKQLLKKGTDDTSGSKHNITE